MKMYGNYGIGMSKKWGMKRGICPVFYVYNDSHVMRTFRNILNNAKKTNGDMSDDEVRIVSMTKAYCGVNYREKKQYKKYLYYDEREWRYVPELEEYGQIKQFDSEDDFYKIKNALDENVKNKLCTFDSSDVKYLLVNDMDDCKNLMSSIDKMENYSDNEKDFLKSKIILNELIKKDI